MSNKKISYPSPLSISHPHTLTVSYKQNAAAAAPSANAPKPITFSAPPVAVLDAPVDVPWKPAPEVVAEPAVDPPVDDDAVSVAMDMVVLRGRAVPVPAAEPVPAAVPTVPMTVVTAVPLAETTLLVTATAAEVEEDDEEDEEEDVLAEAPWMTKGPTE